MILVLLGLVLLCLIVWLLIGVSTIETDTRRKTSSGGRLGKVGHALPMEVATRSFYDFLVQLGRNPRCMDELRAVPGLNDFAKADFSINPKLAAIAFCDARDCYCQLGNSLSDLSSSAGIGFLMFVALLFKSDVSIELLRDPQKRRDRSCSGSDRL